LSSMSLATTGNSGASHYPRFGKKNSLCDVLYLLLIIIFVYHPSVVRHREFVTKSMRMCGSSRILPFIFTWKHLLPHSLNYLFLFTEENFNVVGI